MGGGVVAQMASMGTRVAGWPTVLLTGPVMYLIFRTYRLYRSRVENERKHIDDVSSLHLRTIHLLLGGASVVETRDTAPVAVMSRRSRVRSSGL